MSRTPPALAIGRLLRWGGIGIIMLLVAVFGSGRTHGHRLQPP
ncbi:hypothetical protein ACM26W_03540 [Halomonas sp. HK25]